MSFEIQKYLGYLSNSKENIDTLDNLFQELEIQLLKDMEKNISEFLTQNSEYTSLYALLFRIDPVNYAFELYLGDARLKMKNEWKYKYQRGDMFDIGSCDQSFFIAEQIADIVFEIAELQKENEEAFDDKKFDNIYFDLMYRFSYYVLVKFSGNYSVLVKKIAKNF